MKIIYILNKFINTDKFIITYFNIIMLNKLNAYI